MHCVLETPAYLRASKEAGVTDDERHRIADFLSENPDAGEMIVGTGGARKVRFPFRSKGKSGGVRVITFYAGIDIPVFLLDIYAKGERIDLTQRERNALKAILSDTAESYRRTIREKAAEFGRNRA